MWFSQPKELDNRLLLWLSFSCASHLIIFGLLFLGEQLWIVQSVVISGRSGAQVSIMPHTGKRTGVKGLEILPQQTKKAQAPEKSPPVQEKRKAVPSQTAKKPVKAQPKKGISKPKTPVVDAKKKSTAQPAKKEQAVMPVFSELKKNYTSLKRPKKEEKPQLQKDRSPEALKKEEADRMSELKRSPGAVQSAPKAPSSVDEAAAELIEVNLEEASWSSNEYEREFGKYFSIPPGFDGHEPFTIACEVKEGKVVYINLRGSEPLVLYAAAKDAIMKMTFVQSKYVKKLVFIIK